MKVAGILVVAALVILLIILGPIVVIWALNALFPALAIPVTFKTWFAICVVMGAIKTQPNFNKF